MKGRVMQYEKRKACLCGCGKPIIPKPHHRYTGIPDYIRGHRTKLVRDEREATLKMIEREWLKFAGQDLSEKREWAQGAKYAITKIESETTWFANKSKIRASEAVLSTVGSIRIYDNTKFHQGMHAGMKAVEREALQIKRKFSKKTEDKNE